MKKYFVSMASLAGVVLMASCGPNPASDVTPDLRSAVYMPGKLKPTDSVQKLKVGDRAPDFTLPQVDGKPVTLSHYRGKKNVVLSFVPAAFTPVCSKQWPGYNISLDVFKKHDAELLGITPDNVPSLHAWVKLMDGLKFKVLSDFWPHGKVASAYGVLRHDGVCERSIVVIDKKGIVRFIKVYDINKRPALDDIAKALKGL